MPCYPTINTVLYKRGAEESCAGNVFARSVGVSQALYRPHPPNPSSPVNVYKLLDMFQASTIGVLSEVASPYLVRYGLYVFAGSARYGVRYDLRILYSF